MLIKDKYTPIKKITKTSSPIKTNKEVAFKARDTILPYSPITAPNTWRETGAIPKSRESSTNIKKREKQPVIKQLSVRDLYIPPYRKKHNQIKKKKKNLKKCCWKGIVKTKFE